MKEVSVNKLVLRLAPLALAVSCSLSLLAGCSSGSSDSIVSSTDASISGTIVAAPVNGADVSVVDGNGNVVAGPVKTNDAGEYTLSIPNTSLAQDLIVKSTGGTFTDEATGNPGTAGEMYAYASANSLSNGSRVSATPGSAIIANIVMNHSKSLAEAETLFASAFGYTPDVSVTPVDATVTPAADASVESKLAGLRAAAFSQLAMELGLEHDDQFEMFAALAQDLSDGALDGGVGIVSINPLIGTITPQADIQNRYTTALLNFHNSGLMGDVHGDDQTGLTSNQIGVLPFAKLAISTTGKYNIVYESVMMEPINGKTKFNLTVTEGGVAVDGLMVTLMPMMNMEAYKHSTPDLDCTGAGSGVYNCTMYYLMPSAMAGVSMGYWELNVMAGMGGESAIFYPNVMMAMGDTPQVRLKGVADTITNMDGLTVGRTYFLFKENLTGMGPYDFSVFIAAQQDMMNFPAVFDGSMLSGNLLDATVEISDDDGANWILATDGGNGVWTATGLTLTDGVEDQIRIRLTIDDTVVNEMKTTNGLIREIDVNDYQTFTVTPGMSM